MFVPKYAPSGFGRPSPVPPPDLRGQVPLPKGPHHVHVFSHTYDMCVPLVIFISEESL